MRPAQFLIRFLLFPLCLVFTDASAQTRLYTAYTKADGLPSDYVMRIYQSPGGYMWFGTERGAARYDGHAFTTFTTENGLPHNLVYDILEDAQGRTWFATPIPKLAYLRNGTIRILRDSTGSSTPINSIAMDRNNRVFFRFHDGMGVLNGDDYQFHAVAMKVSKESRIELLLDGRLLMSDGLNMLVSRLDSGTDLRLDTLLTLDKYFNFISFDQAPDSTIYITSDTGVTRYRLRNDRLEPMEYAESLFNTTIAALPNNRVALGNRSDGLKLLENGIVRPLITSMGSAKNFVSSQFVDYEGNLWVGFFGQGVEKLTTWSAVVLNEESGLTERNVWRVTTHRDEPLAMSVAGIQRIRDQKAIALTGLHSPLRSIRGIQYTESRVYVASISNLNVFNYDSRRDVIGRLLSTHDMGDGVNDIRFASDGSLWIASAGMRLFRLMTDGTFRVYPMKNGAEKLVRAGDAMWVLTSSDGAHRFANDTVRHYSKASGELPSDAVWSLIEDEHGILIGTAAGLTAIAPNGAITQYDDSNGLNGQPVISVFSASPESNEVPTYWVVTPNQLHQLSNGKLLKGNSLATLSTVMAGTHWIEPSDDRTKMFLASSSGLVIVDLTKTGREIPPPKVAIQHVSIGTQRFNSWMDGEIRHTSSSTTLEFEFSGLTFIKEADTKFSYRLVGVDNDWSAPQNNRTVRYANVSPGTYEFEVRAVNIDGVMSTDIATLSVTLSPPWWMHPIMIIVLLMSGIAALLGGIQWRVQRIRTDIIKRNEQKQFEAIQRIGASISHDIKNTVFSLSLLSKNLEKRFDNPEFRKDAIETIESSLTYLSTLVNRLQEVPTQQDTSRKDISLHALCTDVVKRVTAGTDRRVDLEIDASLRVRVSAEPLERILENLVRNALEATSGDQSVRISASRIAQETEIRIIDNGPGMSEDFLRNKLFKPFQSTKTKGLGIGLYSCKELADAMGATIHVDSELGKGTTFRLRFVTSPS